ncbi:MAG TPA: glutathione S-transferase family protein [Kiloniellales bacterium]
MADVILYGSPFSNFVRSARLALEEKGVPYTLERANLADPEYRRLHPFRRMPALRHGEFRLAESFAIMRYVDEAFVGPSLQPADPRARARMTQWVSAFNDYIIAVIGRRVIAECYAQVLFDRPTDEATIAAALPQAREQLDVLNDALAENQYLAGNWLTLADLAVFPEIHYVMITPRTADLVPPNKHLHRWYQEMLARPSVQSTEPPMHELDAA